MEIFTSPLAHGWYFVVEPGSGVRHAVAVSAHDLRAVRVQIHQDRLTLTAVAPELRERILSAAGLVRT